MDFGLTEQPAPVHLNLARFPSRDYRSSIRDHNSASLNEPVIDNALAEHKWQGNGFPGHVQFVTYIGRERLRPGVKLERDIQISQMPHENAKPLNVTQMGGAKGKIMSSKQPDEAERALHGSAVSTMRSMRDLACIRERLDNPHRFQQNEVEQSNLRQERLSQQAEAIQGLRTAGLASINPRMGTCGSLPNLDRLRGAGGIDTWRTCAPWALDPAMV